MTKPSMPQRWLAAWRSARRPLQDDPADMGTAFGLELSLGGDRPTRPATLAAPRAGWMRRLAERRRRQA